MRFDCRVASGGRDLSANEAKLAADVETAGGTLELAIADLSARLGVPVSSTDTYTQYAVARRLAPAGLNAEFRGGTVTLQKAGAAAKPKPPPRKTSTGTKSTPTLPVPKPKPPDTTPPAPPPTPELPPAAPTPSSQLEEPKWWGLYFGFAAFVAQFFPSVAYQIDPQGKLEDKDQTFWAVYFRTLPLSLAVTASILIVRRRVVTGPNERWAWPAVILIASGIWGLGVGLSVEDQKFFSQVHGPFYVVLLEVAGYVLLSYLVYYGPWLFVASLAASASAAAWIHKKLGPVTG